MTLSSELSSISLVYRGTTARRVFEPSRIGSVLLDLIAVFNKSSETSYPGSLGCAPGSGKGEASGLLDRDFDSLN